MRIIQYFENQPKPFLIGLGMLLVFLIGLIDLAIPPEISMSILYLIPVFLTSWFVSRAAGIGISVLSAIAFFWANQRDNFSYIHPLIPYWNAGVRMGFFLITTYLVSELHNSLTREKKMARTDHVTGVANRRLFYELCNLELKRSLRYGHPFTIAYIDLDDFKNINQAQGQKTGDEILKKVAQTISNNSRETDIIARLGGDEFALLLPGIGYENAQFIIGRIQSNLGGIMQENQWLVTFSIGVITFMNPPETVEEVIEKVDYLMYRIKNSGKNRLEHIIEES